MGRREAWRAYAAGSEVPHFADFCKTHLIQSEDAGRESRSCERAAYHASLGDAAWACI
jgi:hypothetical protein